MNQPQQQAQRGESNASDGETFPASVPSGLRHRYPKRRLWILSLLMASGLIAAEVMCRFVLGLGDPPLSIADPEIEYLFKPSMSYRRFGNRVSYNAFSMRSRDFPKRKSRPNELRVMLLGDSIINGGAQTDQTLLASSLIEDDLQHALGRPVTVGNISAGSWGPENVLAYTRRFGFFDADVVIAVLNSGDYADVPSFVPTVGVLPDFPEHPPLLALQEAVTRYLPRYLPGTSGSPPAQPGPPARASKADIDRALAALRTLLLEAKGTGAKVIVAQHLERDETLGHPYPGHDEIAKIVTDLDIHVVQLAPAFTAAKASGKALYRDEIHPNAAGQRVIADVLEKAILELLAQPGTQPTLSPR